MKKFYTTYFSALMIFASILFSSNSFASHVPGANITYTCVGANQYEVTLTLFEDCGTAFAGNTAITIYGIDNCGFTGGSGTDLSFSLPNIIYQQEVSQLCPTQINQSECNGGSLPGVWMHQWRGIVTLPGACNSWRFWYSLCCRNTSTNVLNAGNFDIYVETIMNSVTDNCNNSAVINSQPIPYVCVNQPVNFNMGASDPDGDSLSYAFIDARDQTTVPVTYNGGYSGAAPIPGATIDPLTGQITFTPTIIGNFVFAVLITEYDANGNVLGSVVQDFQFEVINCTNIVPETPAAGITNIVGAGSLTGPTSIEMCVGDNVCFDLVFTDDDAGQILAITSNIATVLPNATISMTGTNPVTAAICYTSQAGDPAFSTVSFTAEDNACPIAGISSMNIDFTLLNTCCLVPLSAFVSPACAQSNGSITATGQGVAPWDFVWVNANDTNVVLLNESNVNSSTLNNIPAGTYIVTVTDGNGCEREITITLTDNGTTGVTASTIPESCSGSGNGSITAAGSGGTSPYDIVVTSNPSGTVISTNNNTTGNVVTNNLTSGSYTVTVTDAIGCVHDTIITVSAGVTVSASGIPTAETCFGTGDGAIAGGISGGTGPYDYVLTGPSSGTNTTGSFNNLPAGNYVLTVTDANGCFDTIAVTVPAGVIVTANATGSPLTGSSPLTVNFNNTSTNATSYVWIFGDGNTSTATNPSNIYSSDSVFTVTLIASNGPCVDTFNLTVITLQSSVFLPNVFSPNNDANNNTFNFNPQNITDLSCRIYNRWGLLVYEFTSPSGSWNGEDMDGKECADGVYYYVLECTGLTPLIIYDPTARAHGSVDLIHNGTITILR